MELTKYVFKKLHKRNFEDIKIRESSLTGSLLSMSKLILTVDVLTLNFTKKNFPVKDKFLQLIKKI